DKLAEMRSQQHKDWAIRPALTGYNYQVQRLMTDQEANAYENKIIQSLTPAYEKYKEDWQTWYDFDPSFVDGPLLTPEEFMGDQLQRGKINGYRYTDESVFVPSGQSHAGFTANNPFTNGEIDTSEKVTDAQGQKGTV